MGSAMSIPVGGISPTFPVGTLVRVLPTDLEIGHKGKATKWDDDKKAKIGCVGIVCGGRESADDVADVCFSFDGEKKFDFERFQSEWLEEVLDVDAEEQKKFQTILFEAVRLHARRKMGQSKSSQCESAFGPAGTFVKVVDDKPAESELHGIDWGEYFDFVRGQVGVVSLGVGGNVSLVTFGKPVYYTRCFPDAWLEPVNQLCKMVEDGTDEQRQEDENAELFALRDAVVDEKRKEDAENEDCENCSSDTTQQIVPCETGSSSVSGTFHTYMISKVDDKVDALAEKVAKMNESLQAIVAQLDRIESALVPASTI